MRRILISKWWTGSVLSATLLVGLGCSPPLPTPKEGATTATATRQDLVGYTFFDSEVVTQPTAMAAVYTPFKLPVSEVLTNVGKHVNKGDVLVRLSLPEAKVMLSQAQANLQSAQAAYGAAKAQNEGPLREAATLLATARSAEATARKDAQSGFDVDLSAATEARKDAEEQVRLAKIDFDSSVLAEKQALDVAYQFLSEARAGAKASLVRAPISGTVMSLDASVGTDVGTEPKKPVATIVDLAAIEVRARVAADDKDTVAVGTAVTFSSSDHKIGPISGTVSSLRVAPPIEGDKGSYYVAVVGFDNSKGLVRPDTSIKKIGIRNGKVESAITVPVGAVSQNKDGKMVVQVQEGGTWVETPVQTGLTDGALIEIKSGLNEGQIVLVATLIP